MPRPCNCGRYRPGEPFDKGQDCAQCYMWETSEDYRKWHSGHAIDMLPYTPPPPKEDITEPVGTELSKIFDWIGVVKTGSCGCKFLREKMDRWGVAGCRANYALILDKLERAAFERNLPIPRIMFMAPLELAIYRATQKTPANTESAVE